MTEKPLVLDSAIHHALREMAQAIADEHKINILDVHFKWGGGFSPANPRGVLYEIEVVTRST